VDFLRAERKDDTVQTAGRILQCGATSLQYVRIRPASLMPVSVRQKKLCHPHQR
jgi:hypothetical protein